MLCGSWSVIWQLYGIRPWELDRLTTAEHLSMQDELRSLKDR